MDAFVARQPIFDSSTAVYAYELLFRSGAENVFLSTDPDAASAQVMADSSSLFGLDSLTAGRRAFINVTPRILTEGLCLLLPKDWLVVELLETIDPDPEVIAACRDLKDAGYLLALDDFVDRPDYAPLIELADIIKVDFMASGPGERRRLAERYGPNAQMLAEKVETANDVQAGLEAGYEYFQGFFFCKPEMISRHEIPGFKLNYLQLLEQISHPDLDFDQLQRIVGQDVSLTVKLLRLLNSAAFGLRCEMKSVKQALVFLGEQQVKRWATLLALVDIAEDKPPELVITCLIRARLCELLAPIVGQVDRKNDLFLVGMFSLLDAIVGRPVEELISEMPLTDEIRRGLLDDASPLGRVRLLAIALERGNWDQIARLVPDEVSESKLPYLYGQAVGGAQQIFGL